MDNIEKKIEYLKSIETGFVTDALMILNVKDCWMDDVYTLKKGKRFAGIAFTTRVIMIEKTSTKSPYEGMKDYQLEGKRVFNPYEIIDKCPKDSVWVIGGAKDECIMGEHGYRSAYNNGIIAMVMEGRCRDSSIIVEGPMPMYCKGIRARIPLDFKWVDINSPIVCNGAKVKPGDIIIGDDDGVVVIPREHLEEVLFLVKKIIEIEDEAAKSLDEKASPLEVMEIVHKKAYLNIES